MCAYRHACTCACTCVRARCAQHARVRACLCVWVSEHVHVCVHVCAHVCLYACMCMGKVRLWMPSSPCPPARIHTHAHARARTRMSRSVHVCMHAQMCGSLNMQPGTCSTRVCTQHDTGSLIITTLALAIFSRRSGSLRGNTLHCVRIALKTGL